MRHTYAWGAPGEIKELSGAQGRCGQREKGGLHTRSWQACGRPMEGTEQSTTGSGWCEQCCSGYYVENNLLGLGVGGGCRAARADAKVEAETREGLLKYSSGNAGASYLISAGEVRWKEEARFWMCSEGGADSAAGVGG